MDIPLIGPFALISYRLHSGASFVLEGALLVFQYKSVVSPTPKERHFHTLLIAFEDAINVIDGRD